MHHPIDAVKAIMAGADAVQMVSALLQNGVEQWPPCVAAWPARWGDEHGYESIDEMRDSMGPPTHRIGSAADERAELSANTSMMEARKLK